MEQEIEEALQDARMEQQIVVHHSLGWWTVKPWQHVLSH